MESLSDETWDAIISGTSLPQSLLALALSKCDLKILHVDQNDYYGGSDAGLSLDEAQIWVERHPNSQASITKLQIESSSLGPSRAYTISLNPQIIYAKSQFLPTLVSSQIHAQLEFQAVGSFFVYNNGSLQKIPSNREDVFADDALAVRDKRKLMSLLRYVVEEHTDDMSSQDISLQSRLKTQFKIPDHLNGPIQALSLSIDTLENTSSAQAFTRLKRHFMSTGYFGPGLAAVMAKYGGNSEMAQVACRAGAVGGFVYLLGQGIKSADTLSMSDELMSVTLTDGTAIKTKHVVGTLSDLSMFLPTIDINVPPAPTSMTVSHSTNIVSGPLRSLFTATADNGPIPAVAIVLVEPTQPSNPPIYLQIHSEDTGECPAGQCIIYASRIRRDSDTDTDVYSDLEEAVKCVLQSDTETQTVQVLWTMNYTSISPNPITDQLASRPEPVLDPQSGNQKVVILPESRHDLAFDDTILDHVKTAWETILGTRSDEYDFMRFEERKEANDDD